MKRKSTVFYAALVAAALIFSACSIFGGREEETAAPITEPTVKTSSAAEDGTTAELTAATAETTEKQTETTTSKQQTEEKTTVRATVTTAPETRTASGVEVDKGTTSKGYKITEKDGITYIGGIMIANKTYSVPASYNPGGLAADCQAAFNEMQQSAAEDGCTLYISSGFRSYSLQKSLYERYCARDGRAAADRYSARPGNSEHQTGYAIDLNTIAYSFANTAEGRWVAANCYKYGFILRYPEDKESETGYRYEPWHIRYVGISLATDIYNSGLCLEEYFGITSVYT